MTADADLVLGVDGGGSSTVACVATLRGMIVARAEAGPSNLKATGETQGLLAIETAVRGAMNDAGVHRVRSACLGLSGIDHEDDRGRVLSWWNAMGVADRVELVNDADLVLAAGTPEGWGIAVIAGTGSIAVGRSVDGLHVRAGGWGPIFGDEGSGYGTVVAALRLVASRYDGRHSDGWESDPLSRAICRKVGVADPSGLVNRIYSPEFDRARIASLTSTIIETSKTDSRCQEDLLVPAGRALSEIVSALARRLQFSGNTFPLAMAGGFLLSSRIVEGALLDQLHREEFRVRARRVDDPVMGAIQIALSSR